jgi:hypothetical protein
MNALLKDLEKLVEKHKDAEKPHRVCWVPICEEFKTASTAQIYEEKGGKVIYRGKNGSNPVSVLCWVKVHIEPLPCLNVRILETSIP